MEVEPASVFPPYDTRRDRWRLDDREDRTAALVHALAGVELGVHDARVVAWLAGWDNPTVATVCSLIHRARLTTEPPSGLNPGALDDRGHRAAASELDDVVQ